MLRIAAKGNSEGFYNETLFRRCSFRDVVSNFCIKNGTDSIVFNCQGIYEDGFLNRGLFL